MVDTFVTYQIEVDQIEGSVGFIRHVAGIPAERSARKNQRNRVKTNEIKGVGLFIPKYLCRVKLV